MASVVVTIRRSTSSLDVMSALSGDGAVMEVGGPIDETRVTVAVYGEALIPDEISAILGVQPTRAFVKGYRISERSLPMRHGAWFLTAAGMAPVGTEELLAATINRISATPATWAALAKRFDVQIRVGLHLNDWNRGFQLSPSTIGLLGRTGASLGFDIYAYGDDNDV